MPFIQSFESGFTVTYSLDDSEAKAHPLDVYITLVIIVVCEVTRSHSTVTQNVLSLCIATAGRYIMQPTNTVRPPAACPYVQYKVYLQKKSFKSCFRLINESHINCENLNLYC